jgi:Activator of Hsp90 ATPase homolog 1-like protein
VLRFEKLRLRDGGRVQGDPAADGARIHVGRGERSSIVRFDLAPDGDGTHLTLTHTLREDGELAGFGAGWHHHVELLSAHTSTGDAKWDSDRYEALKAEYERIEAGAR